jgi:hypothetical protein
MIREVWDWLHRQFLNTSPLGTPENPEILEPGERPPKARQGGRLRLLFTLISALVMISAPAAFMIWACLWLIDMGTTYDGAAFAWLLLVLFAPITLALAAGTFVIDAFLLLAIVATLSGRRAVVMNFARGPRPGPGARSQARTVYQERDVTYTSSTLREIPVSSPDP